MDKSRRIKCKFCTRQFPVGDTGWGWLLSHCEQEHAGEVRKMRAKFDAEGPAVANPDTFTVE